MTSPSVKQCSFFLPRANKLTAHTSNNQQVSQTLGRLKGDVVAASATYPPTAVCREIDVNTKLTAQGVSSEI